MQNVLEVSRKIMDRFVAAAADKEQRLGDWRILSGDRDAVESRKVVLEQQIAEAEAEKERWEALLADSLTPEQQLLKTNVDMAEAELDVMGEEAYEDAMREYEASIEQNPKQKEYLDESKRLEQLRRKLVEQVYILERSAKYALICRMSAEMDEDAHYSEAIRMVLQSGFDRQRFGVEHHRVEQGGHNFAVIHSEPEDRKMAVMLMGVGRQINLDEVHNLFRPGGAIETGLKDASLWKRVKTRGVEGYMIETDESRLGMVYNVVNMLSLMPQYAGECQHVHVVDGTAMTGYELYTMTQREFEESRALGEQPPDHHVKRRIVLTGKAATDILGVLGLDIAKDKGVALG